MKISKLKYKKFFFTKENLIYIMYDVNFARYSEVTERYSFRGSGRNTYRYSRS